MLMNLPETVAVHDHRGQTIQEICFEVGSGPCCKDRFQILLWDKAGQHLHPSGCDSWQRFQTVLNRVQVTLGFLADGSQDKPVVVELGAVTLSLSRAEALDFLDRGTRIYTRYGPSVLTGADADLFTSEPE